MEWGPILAALIAALFGGGGLYALLKLRPEAGEISVRAAEKAVVITEQALNRLDGEMTDMRAELKALHKECEDWKEERKELRAENARLRRRIAELEGRVAETMDRIEAQGTATVARDEHTASDLTDRYKRADAIEGGQPGEASDAASRSGESE